MSRDYRYIWPSGISFRASVKHSRTLERVTKGLGNLMLGLVAQQEVLTQRQTN